jgi:anti-sigma factor RsiW
MKCESIYEDLQAFLDDELEPAARQQVADHLAQCEACREVLKDLRAISGALTKWSVPEPVGLPTSGALLARAAVSVADRKQLTTSERTVESAGDASRALSRWTDARNRYLPVAAAVVVCVLGVVAVQFLRSEGTRDIVQSPSLDQPSFSDGARKAEEGSSQPSENAARPGVMGSSTETGAEQEKGQKADSSSQDKASDQPTVASEPPAISLEEDEDSSARGDQEVAAGAAQPPAPAAPPASKPVDEERQQEAAKEAGADEGDAKQKKKMIAGVTADDGSMNKAEGARALPSRRSATAAQSPARLIAKSGTVAFEADDAGKAAERIAGIARSAGGFVQSQNSGTKTRSGGRSESIVVRVPSERFESVISSFRSLAPDVNVSTSSVDLGPALAEADAIASGNERENKDARSRSESYSRLNRDSILERVRLATIKITVTQPPKPQSSAGTSDRPIVGSMTTSGGATSQMRGALGRGIDRAGDVLFLVVLALFEFGPSALVVGAALFVAHSASRRVRVAGLRKARVTSPLA